MKHGKHILIAYLFHLIPIILGFVSGRNRFHFMGLCAIIGTIAYIIYWCRVNRKQFLTWSVFVHFLIGAAAQIILNKMEIIRPDGGFMPGLGQYFYIIYVQVSLVLVGLTNLILWLIDRRRKKKQAASEDAAEG
ncbi:MAG: hypothetical protein IKG82_12025 [Oscillospiraceae bacterium]|nr:hypothetical protein [Oscillospiraceae bacterium]